MTKSQLRAQMLAELQSLDADYKSKASATIVSQLDLLMEMTGATKIASFDPFQSEPQIQPFNAKHHIAIPQTHEDGFMDMVDATGKIIPPENIELILIPCLAYDPDTCDRLGRGRSYYDRYLAECTNALKVIVAFSIQAIEDLPIEPHDLPADLIVTETGR